MGVDDDPAVLRLPEDLRERGHVEPAGSEEISQHRTRPHRRKLIGITDQHHRGARTKRPKERLRQQQIQHRHLVDDQQPAAERRSGAMDETAGGRIELQQPVQRLRGNSSRFRQPLRSAAGRSSERDRHAGSAGAADDLPHHGGFSDAGPPGDDRERCAADRLHRRTLSFVESEPRLAGQWTERLPGEPARRRQRGDQLRQFGLGPEQQGRVDHPVGTAEQSAFEGCLQPGGGAIRLLTGEFGGLSEQFRLGAADMPGADQRVDGVDTGGGHSVD